MHPHRSGRSAMPASSARRRDAAAGTHLRVANGETNEKPQPLSRCWASSGAVARPRRAGPIALLDSVEASQAHALLVLHRDDTLSVPGRIDGRRPPQRTHLPWPRRIGTGRWCCSTSRVGASPSSGRSRPHGGAALGTRDLPGHRRRLASWSRCTSTPPSRPPVAAMTGPGQPGEDQPEREAGPFRVSNQVDAGASIQRIDQKAVRPPGLRPVCCDLCRSAALRTGC